MPVKGFRDGRHEAANLAHRFAVVAHDGGSPRFVALLESGVHHCTVYALHVIVNDITDVLVFVGSHVEKGIKNRECCLLYTSDAADE